MTHDKSEIKTARWRETMARKARAQSEAPGCVRDGCGHRAWAHGDQSGWPTPTDSCHAVIPLIDGPRDCTCSGYQPDPAAVSAAHLADDPTTKE